MMLKNPGIRCVLQGMHHFQDGRSVTDKIIVFYGRISLSALLCMAILPCAIRAVVGLGSKGHGMKKAVQNSDRQKTVKSSSATAIRSVIDEECEVLQDEAEDDLPDVDIQDDDEIEAEFEEIDMSEDEDLLPESEVVRESAASSKKYEVQSIDVDSPGGMLALRNAFKPGHYVSDPSADPLTVYLSHIRNHPILDSDSQQKLALRYRKENDMEAAQLLVMTNLRLVVKIAREYKRRWVNLLELIQEGNVGLSEAIQRYDPYRHVKFTSYAQYWIRAMILNYLMNHFQPIRIGSTRAGRKLFYNLKKARLQLQREGITNPTPALVAERLGVSEQDVIDVSRHLDQPALSIDQTAPGYENTTIGELLHDDSEDSPEETVANEDFYGKVHDIMLAFGASLTDPREQALWNRRLIADDPVTLSELGAEYHISKERIRQIEARLKERFKLYISQRIDGDISTYF